MSSTPYILLVDDDPDLRRLVTLRLQTAGHQVVAVEHAEAALAQMALVLPQLLISDIRLPGMDGMQLFEQVRASHPGLPVILLTAHGSIPDAVDAAQRGVFDYLSKPFDGKLLLQKVAAAMSMLPTPAAGDDEGWHAGILSRSAVMQTLLAEARLLAQSDASVLIQGESGSGKELLAQAVHRASPRRSAPFIAVNCGAIPESLLESELFGHVKGSFTGAVRDHEGLFQAADGGTLFLDEIGDMPLPLQVKLLRVLQERAVRPLGAAQARKINVRILSATHRNLDEAMQQGQFREDLYYRLNVVSLHLPSLSARREDIPLLANHFLLQQSQRYDKLLQGFVPEAMEMLVSAPWPGNIRQLYNVVEQVSALATSPLIPLGLVQRALRQPSMESLSYAAAKQAFERQYLIQLLKLTDGNVAEAAKLADRNRTEFYRLLQRHALTPSLFRGETLGEPAPVEV
ncbi:sigma 54-interacting transcriptional regulator [Leeia aquatica]|uniref:Sigma 54-interacting transcriptional regulator n=1 Tax=Leeia aquatica TaxID=2725557 RepID=A0A847SBD8_9NEIS|nr:sigma 54-interacting transcriptional regulator [Leeia aquatica]NLR76217.1 sigma 54-interacting transcriptional regulator [Leeia aquatica]